MVDNQPNNYESLSQPGLKEQLLKNSQEYKRQAKINTGLVVVGAAEELVMAVLSIKIGNINVFASAQALILPQIVYGWNERSNNIKLAKKFAGAIESMDESKIRGNPKTINLVETQAELLKISGMENNATASGHVLLEIAREQAKRMPVITKYTNTNDLQMLDTQRNTFQEAYIEFRLSDETDFVAPELKTISSPESDSGLVDFKNAWMNVAKTECEWAMAKAAGNKDDAKKFDIAYYATTLDDSRGLDGNLVQKVVDVKNKLPQ